MRTKITNAFAHRTIEEMWQHAKMLVWAYGPELGEELLGRVAEKLCHLRKRPGQVKNPWSLINTIVRNEFRDYLREQMNQADIVIERLRHKGLHESLNRHALVESLNRLAHKVSLQ